MGVIIIDTLQRGGSGTSPFPVILEQDSSISYVTVADVTTRDSIPEWKRRSNMQCFVISTGLAYRLGTDLTISGQVWVEIPGVGSGFQLLSEKGQVDGYVPLDGLGKIDAAYINNIYSNSSFTAASEAAMLALTTQTGDIITRTDSSQIFVKLNNNGPPAVIGDFAELLFPGAVLSVNGLTGAVSITFTSLLAWASNQTEFDAAVTANTTVAGNSGAITINQTDISTLQGEVLALQNATKQITDFDSGIDYVVTVDYVVFPEATSGILELFKCIQSTSNPSPDPTNPAYWERIGDYLTTTEIAALLVLKADLVAGVVPLAQLPPEVFSGTVIVADITFRDAYTLKIVGLVFYVKDASADPEVTTGAAEYIYKPSDPLADGEGFVLKENPGTDDIDEGSSNLYYTEARVDANASVAANTTHRGSDGSDHSAVVLNTAKVSADGSIDTHSDVDISTVAPVVGQSLLWNGADFIPYTPQENLTEPSTWYVHSAPEGNNSNVGSANFPFETIQAAHDAAAANDTIIIQNIYFTQPTTPATTISKTLVFKGMRGNIGQFARLRGAWTIEDGVDIWFENISLTSVTLDGPEVFAVYLTNCSVSALKTGSSRYIIFDVQSSVIDISTPANFSFIQSYNSKITGDLTIGRGFLLNNSELIGDSTSGLDSSQPVTLYNSTINGDATVTGNLSKFNSVITGTETVSGTTTEKQQTQRESIKVPLGAIGSDHTTGTNKISFHIDYDFYLETVTLEFDPVASGAGPTGSSFIVDINVADIDGTSLATILSTKLSVDAGEYHSSTAATPTVISTNAIAQYKFISLDIDQIGGTLAGKGGYVTLNGFRT